MNEERIVSERAPQGAPGELVKKRLLCQGLEGMGSLVYVGWIQAIPRSFSGKLGCASKVGTRLSFKRLDGDKEAWDGSELEKCRHPFSDRINRRIPRGGGCSEAPEGGPEEGFGSRQRTGGMSPTREAL